MLRDIYDTVDQIKSDNNEIGHHWFSPDTMRFFASRICKGVYQGHLFITSEKTCFDDPTRVYRVSACVEGRIYSISSNHPTLQSAKLHAITCDWRKQLKSEYNLTVG